MRLSGVSVLRSLLGLTIWFINSHATLLAGLPFGKAKPKALAVAPVRQKRKISQTSGFF